MITLQRSVNYRINVEVAVLLCKKLGYIENVIINSFNEYYQHY